MAIFGVTAYYGQDLWTFELFNGFKGSFVLFILVAANQMMSNLKFFNNWRSLNLTLWEMINPGIGLTVFLMVANGIVIKEPTLFEEHTILYGMAIGFVVVKLSTNLVLTRICKSEVKLITWNPFFYAFIYALRVSVKCHITQM